MRFLAAMTVLAIGLLLQGCMSADRRASRDRDDRRPPPNLPKDSKDDSPWWLEGGAGKQKARLNDAVVKTDRETIIERRARLSIDREVQQEHCNQQCRHRRVP